MKLMLKLNIIFFWLFTSCSNQILVDSKLPNFRNIAEIDEVDPKEVLTIYKQEPKSKASSRHIVTWNQDINFIERNDLAENVAFVFGFNPDGKGVTIYHSPEAFNYPLSVIETYQVTSIFPENSNQMLARSQEFIYNILSSDPEAIDVFLKLRIGKNLNDYYYANIQDNLNDIDMSEIKDFRELVGKQAHKLLEINRISLDKHLNRRKSAKRLRKEKLNKLDKALPTKQLRYLVANNDRKGVVKLLRAYLPIEDMAPFEKKYWETMLDIVENPLPPENRVLIYRGLGDNPIYSGIKNGEFISDIEAMENSNAFTMSTMLTKNQGSWNRRLRSLEMLKVKPIGLINGSSEFSKGFRLTVLLKEHANNPQSSPFMSFTPDLNTALAFGSNRGGVFLMDPRLIQFNIATSFTEFEFIVPLITFPDEAILFWNDIGKNSDKSNTFQIIQSLIAEKIKPELLEKVRKNTDSFFKNIMAGFKIKSLQGQVVTTKAFAKDKAPIFHSLENNQLTCTDMVTLFLNIP